MDPKSGATMPGGIRDHRSSIRPGDASEARSPFKQPFVIGKYRVLLDCLIFLKYAIEAN